MFNVNTKTSDYMSIVLTHECNKQCPYCIDKYRGRKEYITLDNIKKAITFAKKHNIKDILLVGGEPTLHPQVVEIAKMVKEAEFNTILTTNYTRPDVVKDLDKYVNSFNISFYNQKELPKQKDFKADLTLSTLLYKGGIDSKEKLDAFIEKYKDNFILKFSTLTVCNDWTSEHQKVDFLDSLNAKRIVLFNEIEGLIYKDYVIKRYDRIINLSAEQSFKCHVDGNISNSWERVNIPVRPFSLNTIMQHQR
ncbi:MAG: radical SAM protein [Alphaproteobacteria bacterium]